MKRYLAGATVPAGLYWRPRSWDIRAVSRQAGVLEGETGARYLRIPLAAIPLAGTVGLVLGGLYVLLLPLVGAAALVAACAARLWRWLVAHAVAPTGPLRARFTNRHDGR